MLVMTMLALVASAAGPDLRNALDSPEAWFSHTWNEPIVPQSQRPVFEGMRMPSVPAMHREIVGRKPTKADLTREAAITRLWRTAAPAGLSLLYFRVLCRASICEAISILPELSNAQAQRTLSAAITGFHTAACPKSSCEQAIVHTGRARKNDGPAMISYFIDRQSPHLK